MDDYLNSRYNNTTNQNIWSKICILNNSSISDFTHLMPRSLMTRVIKFIVKNNPRDLERAMILLSMIKYNPNNLESREIVKLYHANTLTSTYEILVKLKNHPCIVMILDSIGKDINKDLPLLKWANETLLINGVDPNIVLSLLRAHIKVGVFMHKFDQIVFESDNMDLCLEYLNLLHSVKHDWRGCNSAIRLIKDKMSKNIFIKDEIWTIYIRILIEKQQDRELEDTISYFNDIGRQIPHQAAYLLLRQYIKRKEFVKAQETINNLLENATTIETTRKILQDLISTILMSLTSYKAKYYLVRKWRMLFLDVPVPFSTYHEIVQEFLKHELDSKEFEIGVRVYHYIVRDYGKMIDAFDKRIEERKSFFKDKDEIEKIRSEKL